MNKSFLKKIFYFYFPVVFWMGLIFYLSSIPSLKSGVSNLSAEIIIRKSAHIIEFAVLAFLFWRIFYFGEGLDRRRAYWVAFIASAVFAVSDEVHQRFINERSGRIIDVIVDVGGAVFSLLLIDIVYFQDRTKKKIYFLALVGMVILLVVLLMVLSVGA
jgi:VanZ family protein